jgi:membrane-associated phospholipid phosphatase
MMPVEPLTQSTRRHPVARAISIIVHPILLPLVTLGVLAYLALGGTVTRLHVAALLRALELVGIAVLVTAAPIAVIVIVQVARGSWKDTDVSVREQRYLLYPFGIACMLLSAGIFDLIGAPGIAIRSTFGLAGANVVNGLINLRYKVSAHATAAALCSTLFWLATPRADNPALFGAPVTVAAVLVGWSRVALGRHTVGQVILGWVVGVASGVAVMTLV